MVSILEAYSRLVRLDKPVGIWLLWFPAAWALWVANKGSPPWMLVFWFFLGTVVMRSAGCVMNDLADRNIDKHISRTAKRPITTGEVSVLEGLVLLASLLVIAFVILLQLPSTCVYYAFIGLTLTVIYPFCKRWIQAPQLVLSLAFSVAIPMVYVASNVPFDSNMVILMVINICWVIAYDTMYAMVDRKDDLSIGVKSTAVLFGSYDTIIIFSLQSLLHVLWLFMFSELLFVAWVIGAGILLIQQKLIQQSEPTDCFKAFKISIWYGLVMWISLLLSNFSYLRFSVFQ